MRYQHGGGVRSSAKAAISAALFAGASLALPLSAMAADAQGPSAEPQGTTLDGVTATAAARDPESPKYTAALLDTPQTITVVPKEVIEAQNLMSLRDILSTVPGITFGAGEGGAGFGDSINLRGYSANSDITVDGVRDSAQYTRSDPFNLEQIEVVNGANSVYAGSGSIGGSVNLVSKMPRTNDQTALSVGVGTDGYMRGTVDTNHQFSDTVAGRLNLMLHSNDAPGRKVETFQRWGLAPSLTVGIGTPSQFNVSLFYQNDDNVPQYGVGYAANSVVNGPLPGVDPSNYYGYRNVDRQESDVGSATFRIDHAFSDNLSIRNLTRYQIVEQLLVVDPPQGTYCLANGINPQTGASCSAPGTFVPSGPRGNRRDSKNTTFYNQTDLRAEFDTAGFSHTLTAGVSVLSEDYRLDNGNVFLDAAGAKPPVPPMNLINPDTLYTAGPINFVRTGRQDGRRENQAVYVFDTIAFNEQFEVNGGLRWEHNQGSNRTDVIAPDKTVTPGQTLDNNDELFSYRLGAVYKPAPNASLYVAYGNSQTPSQTAVNGGCTAINCNVKPEEGKNYEIGGKWDTEGGISLTASIFRNERSAFRVASGDPSIPDEVLDGRSRVDGLALGASGVIRKGWAAYVNYTYLDSELLQGVADGAGGDFRAGDPLPNTPKHALSIWTTYDITPKWQVGYGATYSGEYAFNRSAATATLFQAPDYWLHSLAVTWRINRNADLRLNVRNLTDEEYYTRIRASGSAAIGGFGWATPGDTRNASLTLNYRF